MLDAELLERIEILIEKSRQWGAVAEVATLNPTKTVLFQLDKVIEEKEQARRYLLNHLEFLLL